MMKNQKLKSNEQAEMFSACYTAHVLGKRKRTKIFILNFLAGALLELVTCQQHILRNWIYLYWPIWKCPMISICCKQPIANTISFQISSLKYFYF